MPDFPVMLVEWLAPVPPPGPSEPSEADEAPYRLLEGDPIRPHVCRMVGWLIEEAADSIMVAQNFAPADAERDWEAFGNPVRIPRELVQRIRTLLPKHFDRLSQADQETYFKLLEGEMDDMDDHE